MVSVSPSRSTRLRAKTSDLTDFFRGSSHSTQPQQPPKDSMPSAIQNLGVPLSGDESTSKKKITRIPLFGRSRKKSNQSTSSSPFASSSVGRDSSEGGELSSTSRGPSTDRRPSEPSLIGIPPPLPVPSKVPPSSLSSKFAARFSHSRSSKTVVSHPESSSLVPAAPNSGLHPPGGTRSASFESGSSIVTKSRSTTPRPAKPTITVSLSPDNVEEFQDLFTRPPIGDRTESSRTVQPSKTGSPRDSNVQSPSSIPSSRNQSPDQSIYRRGHTPASAIAAAVRDRQVATSGNERPPSTSSKNSRNNSDSDKSHERNSGGSTPRLSEARESPRLVAPDVAEKGLPPSLGRRSSVARASEPIQTSESVSSSSSLRSRLKHPSSPSRSKPPTMPLPLPPAYSSTSPPTSPRLQHYSKESISSSSSQPSAIRPRAHTISSGVNPSFPHHLPLSPTTSVKSSTTILASPPIQNETLDIDNASAEQLRQALKTRNQQYDELATFVLKMTEAHVAEVTALEKKIVTLEKDAIKLEKQVQGFTWMINGNEKDSSLQPKPLPSGILNHSRFATSASSNDSDQEVQRTALPGAPRRVVYNSDSGAESHATSGAESLRASGASGSESLSSMVRNKKLRRPYPLGDSAYVASRSGSILRSSKLPPGLVEKGLPDVPIHATVTSKRMSMGSTSISPSSSTSSLLPPSPSITMSSLSAIPEAPTSVLRIPRADVSEHDDRHGRASNRISTSSMTSSSTAASSSYSANIKRSRPPSIAQVLENTPKT